MLNSWKLLNLLFTLRVESRFPLSLFISPVILPYKIVLYPGSICVSTSSRYTISWRCIKRDPLDNVTLVLTSVVILASSAKFGNEGVVDDGRVEGRETNRKEYAEIAREREISDGRSSTSNENPKRSGLRSKPIWSELYVAFILRQKFLFHTTVSCTRRRRCKRTVFVEGRVGWMKRQVRPSISQFARAHTRYKKGSFKKT